MTLADVAVLSAVRTAIGTAFKGALKDTRAEQLAASVVAGAAARAGVDSAVIDDVVLAESLYGGGDLARHAAVELGWIDVPGQAVNRHCAGSLTAVGNAAAQIAAGMAGVVVAGGVQSSSTAPALNWTVGGPEGPPPTFPYTADANDDVTISVGHNVAEHYGLSREAMDTWAVRSHERAVTAIEAGVFTEEIVPVTLPDGAIFDRDEHPRPGTSREKLTGLKVIHPEIEGFSITAGNASGINDGASALVLANPAVAEDIRARPLAFVRGWTSVGVDPAVTGIGAIRAIEKLMDLTGLEIGDIDLWEINEAFASVPLAACRVLGINDAQVNTAGSGCSLGHPVAASGGRMLTTLIHQLRRAGGGRGVAAMCAGGGQGGAVLVEVPVQ